MLIRLLYNKYNMNIVIKLKKHNLILYFFIYLGLLILINSIFVYSLFASYNLYDTITVFICIR